jgi:glutathione gamma-glutamylcysteinyltransferase
MDRTLYRRPLPADAIAFSSPDGRRVFAEALAAGGLDGYFPLAEQFHTQADPAFCGLGSLVVALNALGIDPGRLWKGPWRWFAEDLLDCCVPLDRVRERGLNLDELTCLARCNGADVELHRTDGADLALWRGAVESAAQGETVVVASYDRSALGQTGSGHFSPVGGYHRAQDLALVLDVARFKYPPHWVPTEHLWRAMQPVDPITGRARGWMVLRRRSKGIALGFSVRCEGESWTGLARRLTSVIASLEAAADLQEISRAVLPLTSHLELRSPNAVAHAEALTSARAALRQLVVYPQIVDAVGEEHAEGVLVLLLAMVDLLPPALAAARRALATTSTTDAALVAELENVRAQLVAVWEHAVSPGQ